MAHHINCTVCFLNNILSFLKVNLDSKWKLINILVIARWVDCIKANIKTTSGWFDYGVALSASFKVDSIVFVFFFKSEFLTVSNDITMKQLLIRDQTHSNEYRTILADTNQMWAWQYYLNIVVYIYIANNFICFHVTILSAFTWHLRAHQWNVTRYI